MDRRPTSHLTAAAHGISRSAPNEIQIAVIRAHKSRMLLRIAGTVSANTKRMHMPRVWSACTSLKASWTADNDTDRGGINLGMHVGTRWCETRSHSFLPISEYTAMTNACAAPHRHFRLVLTQYFVPLLFGADALSRPFAEATLPLQPPAAESDAALHGHLCRSAIIKRFLMSMPGADSPDLT